MYNLLIKYSLVGENGMFIDQMRYITFKMNGMSTKIKIYLLPFIFTLMIAACGSQRSLHKASAPEITPDDSTEYELLVFDQGFETWYLLKPSPALDHGIEYYKNWNSQYVNEWNYRSGTSRFFGSPINYDRNENYPIEIEHKLYYYFQYVEQELNIPILRGKTRVSRH